MKNNKNKANENYIEFDANEFLNLPNLLGMNGKEFDKFISDYLSGNLSNNDFEKKVNRR